MALIQPLRPQSLHATQFVATAPYHAAFLRRKRPLNNDLNAMGVLELYANLVLFIYRDEVYADDSRHKGKAEILLSKNINGSVGGALNFDTTLSRFRE